MGFANGWEKKYRWRESKHNTVCGKQSAKVKRLIAGRRLVDVG